MKPLFFSCATPVRLPDEEPERITSTDLKVAEAAGAQAVAEKSQEIALALQKRADKAMEADHPNLAPLDRLRALAHRTTEEVIQLLKEMNSPKE